MNQFPRLTHRLLPYTLVALALASYTVVFADYHHQLGLGIASLATIPVVVAGWYFGIQGGILVAFLTIAVSGYFQSSTNQSLQVLFTDPGNLLRMISLLLVAVVTGRLSVFTRERREAVSRLAHSNDLIYSILQITTHMEKALAPGEIEESLSRELQQLGMVHAIALHDTHQRVLKFNSTSIPESAIDELEAGLGYKLTDLAIPSNYLSSPRGDDGKPEPVLIAEPEVEINILLHHLAPGESRRVLETFGIQPDTVLFRLPLMLEEHLLGYLWLWGNRLSAADLPVLSIFAKQIGLSLERARLFQEVQELALTDPLTNLLNRRSLFELGRIEFLRTKRADRPFSCAMLDLDHFKRINDTYGHQTGDKVLQEFAFRSKNMVREVDIIGRYGGEELIILMPDTSLAMATKVAERLRINLQETSILLGEVSETITVSIGIATKDENTPYLETLIARADQAMYIAKHRGRNCVAVSK